MWLVRSHFRSRWFGVVLAEEDRSHMRGCTSLLTIVVVRDRRGILMRKRKIVRLDKSWTTPATFTTADVNPDWLRLTWRNK